jgi:hypothetical protein
MRRVVTAQSLSQALKHAMPNSHNKAPTCHLCQSLAGVGCLVGLLQGQRIQRGSRSPLVPSAQLSPLGPPSPALVLRTFTFFIFNPRNCSKCLTCRFARKQQTNPHIPSHLMPLWQQATVQVKHQPFSGGFWRFCQKPDKTACKSYAPVTTLVQTHTSTWRSIAFTALEGTEGVHTAAMTWPATPTTQAGRLPHIRRTCWIHSARPPHAPCSAAAAAASLGCPAAAAFPACPAFLRSVPCPRRGVPIKAL